MLKTNKRQVGYQRNRLAFVSLAHRKGCGGGKPVCNVALRENKGISENIFFPAVIIQRTKSIIGKRKSSNAAPKGYASGIGNDYAKILYSVLSAEKCPIIPR